MGTFEGNVEDKQRELNEIKSLRPLLERLLMGRGENEFSAIYRCKQCGQYWYSYEEPTGTGERLVYVKTTLPELRQKFPGINL